MSGAALYRRRFLKAGALGVASGLFLSRTGHVLAGAAAAAATPATTATTGKTISWRNWSGIQTCQARSLATPADADAIAALLKNSTGAVRCVGSGHSFTALVPTDGTILSLDRFSGIIAHDKTTLTATVAAGTRLALLSRQLDALGLGMRNLPDVDVQSLAGALATATHGTGAHLPALHADVIGLKMVTAQGEVVECGTSNNPDLLAAAKVSLGSLGVITQVTMRVVPAYNLQRKVWILPLEELLQRTPALAQKHRHFEFYYLPFTGYAAAITHDVYSGNEVLMPPSQDEQMLRDLQRLRDWAGKFPTMRRWIASKLIDPNDPKLSEKATNRSWRLLSNSRPTKFNETECHVPQEQGIACLREVIRTLEKRNEAFFPLEFRFVKGDDAWLSPFHQRDSCSIAVHAAHGEAYDYLLSEIGPVYRHFKGRPHWGKLHQFSASQLADLYPRWNDFQALRKRMDPQGRLLNAHLRTIFGAT